MTEEQRLIYEWIGQLPIVVPNWNKRLTEMYEELNTKWFQGVLPALSERFVCEFREMPRDTSGIFISEEHAAMQATDEIHVRPGIRINAALCVLRDHVKIALLHEMIHAAGIVGHKEAFHMEVSRLMLAGAYNGLL
ncbi:MAG: hypothetical protein M3Y50_15955 [Acidobacteriota bacterium]|nr:hypothetical protein [Acidobacteriota bacterium]